MAIESALRNTSRRALLAGLAGGLAAGVAGALGRASPALATHGDVHLGAPNSASAQTSIYNDTAGLAAFRGQASGGGTGLYGISEAGLGVHAHSDTASGVYGYSFSSNGVFGQSEQGNGVNAQSDSGYGVYALNGSYNNPAVLGWAHGNTGLQGYSGTDNPPVSPVKTGVHGYAAQDDAAVGVLGESASGRGGLFAGARAQVRLKPSTALTHPASGQKGDFFVDKSGRLWFCRGGTSWTRLA